MSPVAIVNSSKWNTCPEQHRQQFTKHNKIGSSYFWQYSAVSIMWVESREWTKLGGMPLFCFLMSGRLRMSYVILRVIDCSGVFNWENQPEYEQYKDKLLSPLSWLPCGRAVPQAYQEVWSTPQAYLPWLFYEQKLQTNPVWSSFWLFWLLREIEIYLYFPSIGEHFR